MKGSTTVYGDFNAAHRVPSHRLCEKNHGHEWTVSVTMVSPSMSDDGELWSALHAVCKELRGRDLNEMLPGVVTTPEGVAMYVHERLILQFPSIYKVIVRAGQMETTVEWALR